MFLTMMIVKPALESTMFHNRFFLVEVLDLCNHLHNAYHHYQDCLIAIFLLKYKNYSTF